jgi:3-hydroxyisobutyrate dehydrogenase-like beta-hydroxyacid dehydrogenase
MQIGFIGLGIMGGHMARHVAGKHSLIVFDVDGAKIESLTHAVPANANGTGARGAVIDTSTTEPTVTKRVSA